MIAKINHSVFDSLCGAYGAPLFLATSSPSGGLTVHTTVGGDLSRLKETALRLGLGSVRVRRSPAESIDAALELETLTDRLAGGGAIVFDPIGAVAQAAGLVAFSRAVRQVFGQAVRGIYFDKCRRLTIVCLTKETKAARDEAEIRTLLARAAQGHTGIPVLVSYRFPIPGVVAIDRATLKAARRGALARRMRKAGGAFAAMLGLGVAGTALAQPQVEGSLGLSGISGDPDDGFAATGQLGLIGETGFVQLDAGAFNSSAADSSGLGLQAGVNNDMGRFGVFGYGTSAEGVDGSILGAYGEFHFDSWTLRLEGGSVDDDFLGSDEYLSTRFSVYFDDNFMGYIAGGTLDDGWGEIGLEHAFSAFPGLVGGASYRSADNFDTANIFLRWYFRGAGENRSLKDRDRNGLARSVMDEAALARAAAVGALAGAYGGGMSPSP